MNLFNIPDSPPASCHWSTLEDIPDYFICEIDPLIRHWDIIIHHINVIHWCFNTALLILIIILN